MGLSVQESGYVLGQLDANTVSTSRVKSRSILKAKLTVLEIQAYINKADIDEILPDIPKGEINGNPTESQSSIPCRSFGFSNFTKTFFVAKNWWDIRPHNSDVTSNRISVHWYNPFGAFTTPKK